MSAVMLLDVPLNISADWINVVFSGCGPIVKVSRWTTTGIFFISFGSEHCAGVAAQHFHGLKFPGQSNHMSVVEIPLSSLTDEMQMRQAMVEDIVDSPAPASRVQMAQATTLFVYGICPKVDERHVYELFEQFGTVNSIRLEVHRSTGRRKNFGYVSFDNHFCAARAKEALNRTVFCNRTLDITFYIPKPS
eukprot:TRINITY_DN923_c0_g1_i1.p1 TRINITY_DN923_c0_g1~~TRINITY_DN923_c0_g1_i1.p1  ORF type:complete len:191 (+),score=12.64 TRINITY_DN923_c0_g1_i1:55-627(+)